MRQINLPKFYSEWSIHNRYYLSIFQKTSPSWYNSSFFLIVFKCSMDYGYNSSISQRISPSALRIMDTTNLSPTPTTPMTLRFWQIHPTKPKPCYIIWNELLQTLASMSMHTKRNKCFNQTGDISTLNGSPLELVKFSYQGSSVSSTETDINRWLAKAWAVIDRLSVIWMRPER